MFLMRKSQTDERTEAVVEKSDYRCASLCWCNQKMNKTKQKVVMSQYERTPRAREREKLTLSLQPCPGMRCWPCPPLLGWLCSWRSVLGVSCPTESRAQQSKTLRHVSHSTHCTHLSASTRPAKRWREKQLKSLTINKTPDKIGQYKRDWGTFMETTHR